LRRVATLVARGAPPEKVFSAVAEEVGQLFPVDLATMCRYEPGRTLTSRPVRIDRYADRSSGPQGTAAREAGVRSAVGTPIIVEGRLWGMISAASSLEQPLPPDTEVRRPSQRPAG
jgi:GAF domain-containing protein